GEPRPPPQLGPLLCNLSQLPEGRRGLLDRSRCSVQRLLPFTQYKDSTVHRRGVVGALRNCCFEAGESPGLSPAAALSFAPACGTGGPGALPSPRAASGLSPRRRELGGA
ncbi:HGH1 protein, partial [Glaucidium brasilianum]|nr:HGH1 protein [Glaucidium brasilianum]